MIEGRKALKEQGIEYNVKDMMLLTKSLAVALKPALIPPTVEQTAAQKNADIKPNKEFDKEVKVEENPTLPETGKEEATSSDTETVETVIETAPVNEQGEPAATATEAAPVVVTAEVAVEEKPLVPLTLGPDFKAIHRADKHRQFSEAVRIAYVNNKGEDPDDKMIFAKIISAIKTPEGGKYITQICRNSVTDTEKQINNIVHPKPETK
jgi:hypothetical protein